MNCLYTLFKYRFGGKDFAKSGEVFDNVQRAVDFNQKKQKSGQNAEHCKKWLWRKQLKKPFFSSFRKTKTTQTSGLVFAGRIEKVKRTKFELELNKIVDCFLDGHGNYDSNLVSFRLNSLKQTKIFTTVSKSIQRKQNAS